MAAAKILGVGTPNPRCQCVTLPTKPYSRPKLLYSTSIHPQYTKISVFSARARGRADNSKLLSSGVRRFTIGDVASKSSFKSNQAQNSLRALSADTNGRLQV
ncbi:hypothetical protein CASFOL_026021 [Castilleja foliolosa]|uniref:Uncharacterized protein n=1 Tax=Castilleja foliolosa TaxID=1961234 RepID=A0ABD3CU72_9LAMI